MCFLVRADSLQYQKHILPERSVVFCLCNSVGAFIGRPQVTAQYLCETQLYKCRKSVGENRVLPPCALHTIERYAFKMNRQFCLNQKI